MKRHYFAIAAIACALAACQSSGSGSNSLPKMSNTPASAPQKFECKNGMTATVQYLGNERVSLNVSTLNEGTIQLSQIPSGSGSLYENKNGFYKHTTQWHQKGNQAHLSLIDPYNNSVETACYVK